MFSQLLDVAFDQKFTAFKRDLDEKEAAIWLQLKKLQTESKASSSFIFKGNRVQCEFNSFLLKAVGGAIKAICDMTTISCIGSDNYSKVILNFYDSLENRPSRSVQRNILMIIIFEVSLC